MAPHLTPTTARLLAVCRVHALRDDPGPVGVTAIDKRPVAGPVVVGPLGLRGDVQADRRFHGGEDQALYAYAEEEAEVWAAELGRDVPPGLFGENLRTRGLATTGAVIGERWRIGSTAEVEVTGPRIPCATFGRYLGEDRWVRRFSDAGLVGAYLRVLRTGTIQAGDEIAVLDRPEHGVTVRHWFDERSPEDAHRLLAAHDAGRVRLSDTVHDTALAALARVVSQA